MNIDILKINIEHNIDLKKKFMLNLKSMKTNVEHWFISPSRNA